MVAADEQAIGDQPQGRKVHVAPPVVDKVKEMGVDRRIFAHSRAGLRNAVDDEVGAASLEAEPQAVRGFDPYGRFLTLGAPPVEAAGQRPVGGGACQLCLDGDGRLGVVGNVQLG